MLWPTELKRRVGSGLYRAATTKYPCYVPILGDSEGAGRTGLPVFAAAKVRIFPLSTKYFLKKLLYVPKICVPLHPIMTPEEFHQLKAFARQDGALLSVLWIGSFACYILGIANPLLGTLALLLILVSPIFAANRLRHFRDGAREGVISFRRGYAYTALVFFYAAVLLAAAIYIYFAFIDNGYLLSTVNQFLMTKEGKQLIELYGRADQMQENLKALAEMRPIDYAVNMLSVNITIGLLLALPIAAVMQRKLKVKN